MPWAAFGGRGGEADRFAASGMVRTPDATGWLIVDGPNARIAELSGDGRVIGRAGLPRHLLPQTEGITFGADGTLYLASEGHHGLAVLAAYAPIREQSTDDGATPPPARARASKRRSPAAGNTATAIIPEPGSPEAIR